MQELCKYVLCDLSNSYKKNHYVVYQIIWFVLCYVYLYLMYFDLIRENIISFTNTKLEYRSFLFPPGAIHLEPTDCRPQVHMSKERS